MSTPCSVRSLLGRAIVLLANPNNPTSTAVRTAQLDRLVDGLPERVLIVVDEAYREYVTDPDVPDALERLRRTGQTWSCCARSRRRGVWPACGWATWSAHPDVVRAVDTSAHPVRRRARRHKPPPWPRSNSTTRWPDGPRWWSPSGVGSAAPSSPVASPCPTARATSCGWPSARRAGLWPRRWSSRGVVTRPFPDGVRVTIGTRDENDLFLDALDDALDSRWRRRRRHERERADQRDRADQRERADQRVTGRPVGCPCPTALTSRSRTSLRHRRPAERSPTPGHPHRGLTWSTCSRLAEAGALDVPLDVVRQPSSTRWSRAATRERSGTTSRTCSTGSPEPAVEGAVRPVDGRPRPAADRRPATTSTSTRRSTTPRTSGGSCGRTASRCSPTGGTCRSATTAGRARSWSAGPTSPGRRASSRARTACPASSPAGRWTSSSRWGSSSAPRAPASLLTTPTRHVFGVVLLNDWSARDIQAYEYQPLGPNLAKSFATTISPWVVTLDALRPYLVAPPPQEPEPDPYLQAQRPWALDLHLEVWLNDERVSATNFKEMYWTFAQQLAHMTVNGATTGVGDLYGSGTVSGPTKGERGSLIELTWRGAEPLMLADGSSRTFLLDGDTVSLRGWCGGDAPGSAPRSASVRRAGRSSPRRRGPRSYDDWLVTRLAALAARRRPRRGQPPRPLRAPRRPARLPEPAPMVPGASRTPSGPRCGSSAA